MARGEFVKNTIWSEEPFASLSLASSSLYLWSFTNRLCNMAGVYYATRHDMLASKCPPRKLTEALSELASARMLFYDSGVIWVRARARHLHSKHPNILKSAAKDVADLPDAHPFKQGFAIEYADHASLRPHLETYRLLEPKSEDSGKTLPRVSTATATATADADADATANAPSLRSVS